MSYIQELIAWLQSLPAEFAFLLALPFVVGAAGLWAERRNPPGRKAEPRVERRHAKRLAHP